MLVAAVVGILWGAVLGPYLSLSFRVFDILRWLLPSLGGIIALFAVGIFRVRLPSRTAVLAVLPVAVAWGAIYSPPPLIFRKVVATVVWSRGCGSVADDVIIEAEGRIFTAHGTPLLGDFVRVGHNVQALGPPAISLVGEKGVVGPWCSIGDSLRRAAQDQTQRFPRDVAGWFRGFVIGDKSALEPRMVTEFKDVGLLHVLILSGGHLSVAAALFLWVARIILLVPYVARKITIKIWLKYWSISGFFALVSLFLFCLMVGFSQSVQRAFFAVVVSSLLSMLGFAKSTKSRILMTFFWQVVFFPVNILSPSMLLSWSGSLLLMGFFESTYLKGFVWSFLQVLKIQLLFFGTSLVFFGSVGVLSPLVNLAGQFVFGILLPMNIVAIGLSITWLDHFTVLANRLVLDGMDRIAAYQSDLPVSFISIPESATVNGPVGRCLVVAFMMLFFSFAGVRQKVRNSRGAAKGLDGRLQ
jgi:predicted membrane metal-binding protein